MFLTTVHDGLQLLQHPRTTCIAYALILYLPLDELGSLIRLGSHTWQESCGGGAVQRQPRAFLTTLNFIPSIFCIFISAGFDACITAYHPIEDWSISSSSDGCNRRSATFCTVAALCVQLGLGILKLQNVVKSIKCAPSEIRDLHRDLNLFRALLEETASVAERQDISAVVPISPQVLYDALQNCEAKLTYLDNQFTEYNNDHWKSKTFKNLGAIDLAFDEGED